MTDVPRILVIKLGALGDFVLAFGPFASIRAAHPGAEITLLTTAPYQPLTERSPWFDHVIVDRRPSWWDVRGMMTLRRALAGFDFVYDLQTSSRSGWYHAVAGRPPWSGIARGASHPHRNPGRNTMHTIERQAEQLAMAGVTMVPPALEWWPLTMVPGAYAVLVPGAAPHRPRKRWPAAHFAALAVQVQARGLRPIVIGTGADGDAAETILAACPTALDLTGRTTLLELGGLMRGAQLAVGNDTGPMHLAAALGVRSVVLFSAESDPALTAPRGDVTVLQEPDLADLPVDRVLATLA